MVQGVLIVVTVKTGEVIYVATDDHQLVPFFSGSRDRATTAEDTSVGLGRLETILLEPWVE